MTDYYDPDWPNTPYPDRGPSDTEPIDVWLRFADEDDEEAEAEANTFHDGDGYRVDWDLTSVGLVTSVQFATYDDARNWLISQGFADFTS